MSKIRTYSFQLIPFGLKFPGCAEAEGSSQAEEHYAAMALIELNLLFLVEIICKLS